MTKTVPFTPAWLKDEPKKTRPVFHLREADILDRDEFDGLLDGAHRAGEVPRYQLRDLAVAGLRALLDEADAEQAVALVQSEYAGEELSPTELGQVKEMIALLTKHWPAYQAAVEQEARRNRILPTLAFMRWVDSWDKVTDAKGEPIKFERDDKGDIPQAVLRRLNPLLIRVVGVEAYHLQYGQSEAGN